MHVRSFLFALAVALSAPYATAGSCTTTGTQISATGDVALYRDSSGRSDVLYAYRTVHGCPTLLGSIAVDGVFAFASIAADATLFVETWLMHGDRVAREYRLGSSGYTLVRETEIPGPRPPRRSR
jgi:hypothetical protein